MSYIYIPNKDYKIKQLQNNRDKIIYELDNQYNYYTVRNYKYIGDDHTTCSYCKSNCHSPCYCLFSFRCTIFTFSGYCKKCGYSKRNHNIHERYKYVDENERSKIDNSEKIKKEKDYFWERYNEIIDEYYKMKNLKEKKEREINELKYEKNKLNSEKYYLINEKEILNNKIKEIYKNILFIVLDLIEINNIIKNYGMNQKHYEIENEYINTLIFQLEQNNDKDLYSKIKMLNDLKRYNEILKEINDLNGNELNERRIEIFIDKMKKFLY